MRITVMAAILVLLLVPVLAGAGDSAGFDGRVEKGVVYVERGRHQLKLDVYVPRGAEGTAPVVVAIHGGGFTGGFRGLMDRLCREIAAGGMVVFNIDYRLAPRDKFPAPIEDARCALRWVAAHASEYGGDPARIGLTGESAGAYLAAMSIFPAPGEFDLEPCPAGAAAVPAVSAAVLYYGPYNLETTYYRDFWPIPLIFKMSIGQTLGQAPELYRKFSPTEYIGSDLPPILLMTGTRDYFLPEAQDLYQTLSAKGEPVELEIYQGAKHAFAVAKSYGPWEEHTRRTREFFRLHLQ